MPCSRTSPIRHGRSTHSWPPDAVTGLDPITRLVAAPPWARAAPWRAGADSDAWFRDHARHVADRFARPLLERHRAAADAAWPAVRTAWRLDTLAEDAARAAHDAVAASLRAHEELTRQAVLRRRLGRKGRRAAAIPVATRLGLRKAADTAAEQLQPHCATLRHARDRARWDAARDRLDRAWAEAWEGLGRAIGAAWHDALGPGLTRLDALRPGPPRWLLPLVLAILAAVALAVWTVL